MTPPVLRLSINGVDLPGTIPAGGPAAGPFAVGEASVDWGRRDLLAHPDPATGTLQVFDASNRWALEQDIVGAPVVLRYAGTLTMALTGDPITVDTAFFRGRVGEGVKTRRHVLTWGGQQYDGTLVTLPLRSILVDLANITPTGAWPAETLDARRSRIAGLISRLVPGGLVLRDTGNIGNAFAASNVLAGGVAAVAATAQTNLLAHIQALFDVYGGDSYGYQPQSQSIGPVPRRVHTGRAAAQLVSRAASPGHRHAGAYIRPVAVAGSGATYFDATELVYDDTRELIAPSKVTRVQVTVPGGAVIERLVPGADEQTTTARVATLTTIATDASVQAAAADELLSLVTREAADWSLGSIGWDSELGEELNDVQLTLMIGGYELPTRAFLQGSFLPAYGLRPIVGVIGGTIRHSSGRWSAEARAAPIATTDLLHPIFWGELGLGVTWQDGEAGGGLDQTVTWGDLRHVGMGLGATSSGPNYGWDFYA
jgi:hypothetical protein